MPPLIDNMQTTISVACGAGVVIFLTFVVVIGVVRLVGGFDPGDTD